MPAELATSLTVTEADRLLQAEALVRAYCGWHIAPARTETLTVDGPAGTTVFLPTLYVTAVTSITDDAVVVASDDYKWHRSGIVTRSGWTAKPRAITVSLTHGYATPPADVAAVVQAVAQRAVNNPGSLVRQQIGPFSDTYSSTGTNQVATLALLDSEKEALAPYKIYVT